MVNMEHFRCTKQSHHVINSPYTTWKRILTIKNARYFRYEEAPCSNNDRGGHYGGGTGNAICKKADRDGDVRGGNTRRDGADKHDI